jgi:NADH-quinone oxidoreductase subunit C
MVFTELKNLIALWFGPEILVGIQEQPPQPFLQLPAERIAQVCERLHDDEQTYFDFLSCLTGLDNGLEAGTMEVIYHLYSIPYNHHLCLKVQVPRNAAGHPLPSLPTVSHIWRSADWHEREAYDLMGIHFEGHPDLRRILCAADWQGHPLRKDYVWQEEYHGIKVHYESHNEENGFKGERFTSFRK